MPSKAALDTSKYTSQPVITYLRGKTAANSGTSTKITTLKHMDILSSSSNSLFDMSGLDEYPSVLTDIDVAATSESVTFSEALSSYTQFQTWHTEGRKCHTSNKTWQNFNLHLPVEHDFTMAPFISVSLVYPVQAHVSPSGFCLAKCCYTIT